MRIILRTGASRLRPEMDAIAITTLTITKQDRANTSETVHDRPLQFDLTNKSAPFLRVVADWN